MFTPSLFSASRIPSVAISNKSFGLTASRTEGGWVELSDVTVLELVIVPDQSRGVAARASLKSLKLA